MASTYTLDIYGPDEKKLPLIAEAAFNEVDRIDQLMSIYKTGAPSLSSIEMLAINQFL